MNTDRFFEFYYSTAEVNSMLIMDCEGTVLDVNKAFTNNFGYSNTEIKGRNFKILFTNKDIEENKPQLELETVATKGQSHDENYVVDNKGHSIWCTGESLLVKDREGENYIVKDIINLQAKKQLQLFLIETDELLERIFESSRYTPIIILDGSLKIQKVNAAFLELFELEEPPKSGSRLSDIDHPFWKEEALKDEIRRILIRNESLKYKEFLLETKSAHKKKIRISSKIIDKWPNLGRKIFIIVEDETAA
jgi:PAS domain S-box-containing protein